MCKKPLKGLSLPKNSEKVNCPTPDVHNSVDWAVKLHSDKQSNQQNYLTKYFLDTFFHLDPLCVFYLFQVSLVDVSS